MKVLKIKDAEFGAFRVPHHRKPIIGIMVVGSLIGYGTFFNAKAADAFMSALGEYLGAEEEEHDDER